MNNEHFGDFSSKRRRRRRKITVVKKSKPRGVIGTDDLLKKLNYSQVEGKKCKFRVMLEDAPIADNLIKDAGLSTVSYDETDEIAIYEIGPGPKGLDTPSELEVLEELSDEILEDGEIFD
jgi:hypothetical protein